MSGRKPAVAGLDLEMAGVVYSNHGINVDAHLRTSAKQIYAAGEVTGGYQFTHFAGWQAFQAVRKALLPGTSSGVTDLVPRFTFTDPEIARRWSRWRSNHRDGCGYEERNEDLRPCRSHPRLPYLLCD